MTPAAPYRCNGPGPRRRIGPTDRAGVVDASDEIAEECAPASQSGRAARLQLRHCASRKSQATAGSLGPGCPSACRYRHLPTCAEHRSNRGHTAETPVGTALVGKPPPTGDPSIVLASPRNAEILAGPTPHWPPRRETIDPLPGSQNNRRYLWPA